jgi:ketosteroid isomerase-like protein
VTTTNIAERLQALLDKDEIRELTFMYAHRILTQDWAGLAALFAEDAVVDYTNVATLLRFRRATTSAREEGSDLMIRGRAQIERFFPITARLDVKAYFTNHVIRVTGDAAVGISMFENRVTELGQSVIGAGRMYDEYRRIHGRWRISYRRQELFYVTGLNEGWAEGPDRDRELPPMNQRGWEDELIRGWGAEVGA